MSLYEAIKNKSMEQLAEAIQTADINEQDKWGRTPLHYVITQKAPIEMFKALIAFGANPAIEDKLHETVLHKAIKFKNKQAVHVLIDSGVVLNHPLGIKYTPWFSARHTPEIADILLDTKGAIRLTLTKEEKRIIDALTYSDTNEQIKNLYKLNTPELLHAFVLHFNWDSDLQPIEIILEHPNCQEITAIEMFELADGDSWLDYKDIHDDYEQRFVTFIKNILKRFPGIK